MNSDLMQILQQVKLGLLSVEEAALRLSALEQEAPPPPLRPEAVIAPPIADDVKPDLGYWKYAWLVILWVGILIFTPSALLMNWALTNDRTGWFIFSWFPLLLGLLVIIIGAWSRTARWAHIRVQDADGSRVSISAPIPLGLARWFLHTFGDRIFNGPAGEHMDRAGAKQIRGKEIIPVLEALEHTHDPITVEVDDKDGDRVRVYLM